MTWRKWNNILHRDIGYLIVGLTIVYGVSGLAVNHVADWNPSYTREKTFFTIPPILTTHRDSIVAEARSALALNEEPRNTFRPDEQTLQLFYEGFTVAVDLPTGSVVRESVAQRPVLFEFNQLHLNTPKRVWTIIADLYAVSLILVAITGLFVLKGKYGITGRGAWLTALGTALPAAYWLWYLFE